MPVILLILALGQPQIAVEGLAGGELLFMETAPMEFDIALALDSERVSEWLPFPLAFNPAKTFCEFSPDHRTLEVVSQMPFTADYVFAWYLVGEDWDLTLFDQGDGDYYGGVSSEIDILLSRGLFDDAFQRVMEIMYPGSMPGASDMCAAFVIAAAEVGSPEAFSMAGRVSFYLLGVPIQGIPAVESPDFVSALKTYATMADPATAVEILERIEGHE